MKIYRFYVDKLKSAYADYTEDEFKQSPDINIEFRKDENDKGQTFKGKKIWVRGYKEDYIILTPIENFEVIEDAR